MTVLIAGAGDLGTEAGLRFVAAGHRVVGVRRRPKLLPDSFERQRVDLREAAPSIPDDTGLVVIALTAGERTRSAYERTYVDGVGRLLDAIDSSSARPRILLVSSTAVYDVNDGSSVDESTAALPATETGEVLRQAERNVLERDDAVVLRLGGIYGPGREMLIDLVRSGKARIPTNPSHTNRIHRDDAAEAIVFLGTKDPAPPRLVLGVDREPARLGDVLTFLSFELGRVPPGAGRSAIASGGDKLCRSDLLVSRGFEFAYPSYREGYRAVLAGRGSRHP